MLVLSFPAKLDRGSYIIYITKTVSNKIGVFIRSMKFPSPEITLYLYKSIIRRSLTLFFPKKVKNCK